MKPITLTPKRLMWLRHLETGSAHRNSSVGYWCMKAGWTEWNYVNKETGEPCAWDRDRPDEIDCKGERLTAVGRKIVEENTPTWGR